MLLEFVDFECERQDAEARPVHWVVTTLSRHHKKEGVMRMKRTAWSGALTSQLQALQPG